MAKKKLILSQEQIEQNEKLLIEAFYEKIAIIIGMICYFDSLEDSIASQPRRMS